MTNAKMIKALRICANQTCCDNCPRYDIDHTQDAQRCCIQLINDAADALEAADIKIADYTAAIDALDDSNDAYIKENERLKKQIAELEAQMSKQDEWMMNIRWNYRQPSQSATINVASQSATINVGTTFLCRSTGKLCPNATQYGYCKQMVCNNPAVRR